MCIIYNPFWELDVILFHKIHISSVFGPVVDITILEDPFTSFLVNIGAIKLSFSHHLSAA